MHIIHCVIVLKHTRLRKYIGSLFQAQILACQAGTNPPPRLSSPICIPAIAPGQTQTLGKRFVPENSAPALSPRPPSASESTECRIAVSTPRCLPSFLLLPSHRPRQPPGLGSRIFGVGFLWSLKGTDGALLLYLRHRTDLREKEYADLVCTI